MSKILNIVTYIVFVTLFICWCVVMKSAFIEGYYNNKCKDKCVVAFESYSDQQSCRYDCKLYDADVLRDMLADDEGFANEMN